MCVRVQDGKAQTTVWREAMETEGLQPWGLAPVCEGNAQESWSPGRLTDDGKTLSTVSVTPCKRLWKD